MNGLKLVLKDWDQVQEAFIIREAIMGLFKDHKFESSFFD